MSWRIHIHVAETEAFDASPQRHGQRSSRRVLVKHRGFVLICQGKAIFH